MSTATSGTTPGTRGRHELRRELREISRRWWVLVWVSERAGRTVQLTHTRDCLAG